MSTSPPRAPPGDECNFLYIDDPDTASVTTSGSTVLTQPSTVSTFSSIFEWGPGAMAGKGILAVGEALLSGIESIVIRTRLRDIAKRFPHRDDQPIPDEIYADLVELSR
jgi:hypothetical protein